MEEREREHEALRQEREQLAKGMSALNEALRMHG